jgi:hypothetical protein
MFLRKWWDCIRLEEKKAKRPLMCSSPDCLVITLQVDNRCFLFIFTAFRCFCAWSVIFIIIIGGGGEVLANTFLSVADIFWTQLYEDWRCLTLMFCYNSSSKIINKWCSLYSLLLFSYSCYSLTQVLLRGAFMGVIFFIIRLLNLLAWHFVWTQQNWINVQKTPGFFLGGAGTFET